MTAFDMRPFDTPRLHLRPLGEGDETLHGRLYTDPDLMRHIAPPMSPEAAQRSFHAALKQQGGKRLLWVIDQRNGSNRAAQCGILGVVPEGGAAEVGVMLLAQAQARGFAAEVISAIADVLFRTSAIRRLWTRHASANGPASVLMRNLGFEPLSAQENAAGHLPESELRWQMTCERWQQRHEAAVATSECSR